MDGQEDVVMITGTVMIGGIAVNGSPQDLTATTPVARVADDYEVIVVPADSPYETLDDLLADWKAQPRSVAIGGGSLGGTDQLLAVLLAKQVGIEPSGVNYIPYAGGGEAVASLLSGASDVGISGWNEFADQVEAGKLRALALSAPEPKPEIGVPTLMEQGIDLHLPNWRGVVAPAGLSTEEAQELQDIVDEAIATPEWADALRRNAWADSELLGEEYGQFIAEETARIDSIVKEAGL
nr:tripartite tricarboxylate transporter substrate binding protein [Kineosporia babensis]